MAIPITSRDSSSAPPPADHSADYRLGWAMEAFTEADGFLRNQPLFDRQKRTRDMLLGVTDTLRGALGLSETSCNHLLRIFNIAAADMQDVRPFWRYETFNRSHELQVRNLSNLTTSWWQRSMSDRQLGLTIKQSLISASGVNHVCWDRDTLDFAMPAMNPLDVKPVRPASYDTYQKSLAVIIGKETTVNVVRSMFPKYAHKIVMDRDASITGLAAKTSYAPPTMSVGEAAAFSDGTPNAKLGSLPVVDLFYMYIDDKSRNNTGDTVLMGDWDRRPTGELVGLNHWSYEVKPGDERYPFKRLIIFTRTCVLYDGPSPYWHGMFPVAKLTPEPFPDLWFGISPLWACLPLQESLNKLYRGFDDHIQVFLKPPVSGDRRSLSPAEMVNLDPRRPGQRWLRNPGQAEMKRVEIPAMDPFALEYEKLIRERMDELAGVRNLTSILGLNQMPEGETIDKLFAAMSPESRMRSRNLETYQMEIGAMMAYNIPEFYDEPRVFEILGEDGLTPELYDFDPGTLVPAYTNGDYAPHGMIGDAYFDPETGETIMKRRTDVDLRPRWQRARESFRKYGLKIEPGSLMNSANQSRQMMYLMLRQNKEIPRHMLLEELNVPNIGPRPKGTVEEQLKAEMIAEAEALAQAQAAAIAANPLTAALQTLGMGGGAVPGGGSGAPGGPGGPGGGGPPIEQSNREGRPNTFQEPPHREGLKNSTS
jgi:hypothetical protein